MLALVGSAANETNPELVDAWRALGLNVQLASGHQALAMLRPGDCALGRIDVLPSLDGVEPGLLALLLLERRGVRVLNPARALLNTHDKLRTARILAAAHLPHPRSAHLATTGAPPPLQLPIVLKPRFGSWGADVFRCRTRSEYDACLAEIATRSWFRRHGALVQELLPGRRDLRLVVAGNRVVGAVERSARPGEWRTNISLGGGKHTISPPQDAVDLAVRAAHQVDADLVGVDLLPRQTGSYTIIELNGAVDFDNTYAPTTPIYSTIALALNLPGPPGAAR